MFNSKKLLTVLTAGMLLSTVGCSSTLNANSERTPSNDLTSTLDVQASDTSVIPEKGYYDDVFIEIDESSQMTGVPVTYKETISNIISNPMYGGIDSFYLVETVKALTLSECEQLKGWDEWFESCYALSYDEIRDDDREYFGDKIIYEVKVIEDLISGEKCNKNIYLALSMGNPQIQQEGEPIYSPSERFTVVVHPKADNSDITRCFAGDLFRYDITEKDGNFTALSRNNYAMDELNISNSVNISVNTITSTTNNPAYYTQEMPLDDLTSFIRYDWKAKGISTHYKEGDYESE